MRQSARDYRCAGDPAGDSSFFPTIEAYADAPIIGANKIDILQNGDELFPAMLRDIKSAKSTITFAQYLFKGGTLARELAHSFADRCRAGVKALYLVGRSRQRSP